MKKIFTRVFLICLLLPALTKAQSPNLVISQVSAASNFSPSAYTRSYIEIFNRSNVPVNLSGYSVQIHWIDWTNIVVLPDKILNAGQYYLIAGGNYYSTGALPLNNADQGSYALDHVFLSPSSGEVILAKRQVPFTGNSCPVGASATDVIDKVAWGGEDCYEGTAPAAGSGDYTLALTRKDNGCQDTDDNEADFIFLPANPRKMSSPRNICGLGTSALISAGPALSGFLTPAGVSSSSKFYSLSGYNLTPATGTITLTPPSQDFEISVDNINFSNSPVSFPYTGGHLSDTIIYVRISSSLSVPGTTGTSISGNIIHNGGGAADAIVPLNGSFVDPPGLVVSQVYLRTFGSTTVPYGRNYIEIFNRSTTPISTSGYSIHFRGNGYWSTYPIVLPDTIINAGQYFLIGENDISGTNDIPYDFIPSLGFNRNNDFYGLAISKSNAPFNSCDFTTNFDVVDRVMWSSNALGCQEGPTVASYGNSTISLFRKNAGCQDTNQNGFDFQVTAASPRSLNSTFNISCLGAAPLISAGPAVNLESIEGTTGLSKYYTLCAYNLSPAAGNLTITPPAPEFEISVDNINFFSSPVLVPYTGGQLSVTKIYVRIKNTALFGNLLRADIINSGANAANAIVKVNGSIGREYYNTKADMGLNNPGTWATSVNGTGASPVDFNAAHQRFHIVNQTNAHFNGEWTVSGNDSRIILGDGTNPTSLTINAADSITSNSIIDVLANTTLVMKNNSMPVLGKIEPGTTIDFAQAGITNADTIRIPRRNYYNLKLTNGFKYLSGDSLNLGTLTDHVRTVVEHDLIVDAVVSFNASYTGRYPNSYTTNLICLGDITFLNGAAFGGLQRFNLMMMGTLTQNINSNGTDILLLSMAASAPMVICSPNTNFVFDGWNGVGLNINAGTTLSTINGSITTINGCTFHVSGKIASDGTSFNILRDAFAGIEPEVLAFTPGSTIRDITVNIQYPYGPDSFHIATDVAVTGVMSLTRGKIVMDPGATLHITPVTSVIPMGGSVDSYVEGAVSRTGTTPFTFPVGNARLDKYAPLDFSNYTGNDTYTVSYKKEGYPVRTIDPVTLAANPLYGVSGAEYWNITPAVAGGSVDIRFHYTDTTSYIFDPAAIRMAHFDGTDWNDIGGTPDAANNLNSGNVLVTGVTDFSPFTFGGTAGVVPVKLSNFAVKKQNTAVQIYWTTEQELNSKSFIVERSSDQNKWDAIASVNAAGNSTEKINYSATDFNPAKGINYYRLKQVDLDERFSYSEIRSVYFGSDADIVLAPNPAKNYVTVYLPGNSTAVSVQVYNMKGQLMSHLFTAENSIQLNLTGYSKGIYSIKLSGKSINEVKTLVVE